MNDKLKSLALGELARMELLTRQFETPSMQLERLLPKNPLSDVIQQLQPSIPNLTGIDRLLKSINAATRDAQALRVAIGPFDDLNRLTDQALRASSIYADIQKNMDIHTERFQLPMFDKLSSIFKVDDSLTRIAEQFQQRDDSLRRAVEAMRAPWLDSLNQLESFQGITALQGIGQSVNTFASFEDRLSGILRTELGDWRDQIMFPKSVFDDIVARSTFYVERGFDTRLTDFPVETFAESVDLANLRSDLPALDPEYVLPGETERADNDDEQGFRRTEAAYSQLLSLEVMLRRFIDRHMTAQFGPKWVRSQTPNNTFDAWMEKKCIAEQAGGPTLPLVAYADFTDYVPIITRRDNWKIFKPIFQREESVRESFQRLHPLRLATMHARLLSQDDELFLYVEVRRLSRAIGSGSITGPRRPASVRDPD